MKTKYSIGDWVIISKKLSKSGAWQEVQPFRAKVVDIKNTVTFGPAYTIERNGNRFINCYWEDDIDSLVSDSESGS